MATSASQHSQFTKVEIPCDLFIALVICANLCLMATSCSNRLEYIGCCMSMHGQLPFIVSKHYLSYAHLSNLRFGHLLLFPGMTTSSILLTRCYSSILVTWSYHLSPCSVIFLAACVTFVVPLMCSFQILSLRTSISASSSHLLLVVLLVLSLLPRSLHHTTGLATVL